VFVLNVDGSSIGNPGPGGAGYVISDSNGECIKEGSKHFGRITNNQAEYNALLLGLTEARKLGVKRIEIVTDSELLEKQLLGVYRVKSANIINLFERAKRLLGSLDWSVRWVSREQNKRADQLAYQAAQKRS
jgi:ribonuclease HI